MKKIIFLIALGALLNFAAFASPLTPGPVKKDTVRDLKNQPKPRIVKGKSARMRLQLEQIKYHEKQEKEVDRLKKEIQKQEQKGSY
jgi:cell shape-determining protein MreC